MYRAFSLAILGAFLRCVGRAFLAEALRVDDLVMVLAPWCTQGGLLGADVAWCWDTRSGVKAMAALALNMKIRSNPAALLMEAQSIGSVRLSLMISELNHGQAAEADAQSRCTPSDPLMSALGQ